MRYLRFLPVLLLCICLPGLVPSLHAVNPKQLPPYFRQWIEEDVPYIITQDERREFLKLQTDPEREHFIEQFWESRNPTPHSSINTFKEEHYRRLAYVRTTFGDERYNDGWRTDMGRVYITLGAPQQKGIYHQGMSTRPVEIWFYQSPSPALPIYFNLVFYKRSEADPYTLYSPRADGPTRIVTNDEHDDAKALRTIDKSMGAEATHAMVSLLPNEPISIDHPNPTMDSDLLLDEVRNLPEQKLERMRIARQRTSADEVVTSNIFTGFNATELQSVVLRDSRGLSTVHYIVRKQQPDAGLIGVLPEKKNGYKMTLVTRVMTDAGKAVYERREQLNGETSEAGAKAGREKLFAAEGRLPLVPGAYTIEATLTNDIAHDSTRASQKIIVPAKQPNNVGISGLMAYRDRPLQTPREQLPFTMAGLRFPPRGEQTVELHPGENLPLVYQLWLPQQDLPKTLLAKNAKPQTIHVHYTLGTVSASSGDPNRIDEDQEVSTSDADSGGNLVTGRTLDTTSLQQGIYRLVVRVTDPSSPQSAYAAMTIKIISPQSPVEMWTAFGDEKTHPGWQDDLLRGIAAEALNDVQEASACYRRVLAAKPDAVDAQNHLDALNRKIAQHTPGGQ